MKIAVLDDDVTQLNIVKQALKTEGLFGQRPEIRLFTLGAQMLEAVKQEAFDYVFLDRNVPDVRGDEVLQWLRKNGMEQHGIYTKVILFSNNVSDLDQFDGLSQGADAYFTKPCSIPLLTMRIKCLIGQHRMLAYPQSKTRHWDDDDRKVLMGWSQQVLQESHPVGETQAPAPAAEMLTSSAKSNTMLLGYVFDKQHTTVKTPEDCLIELTWLEYDLALYLFQNAGTPVRRDELLNQVWHQKNVGERTLDVYIHRLRQKLNLNAQSGLVLRTMYGFGYCLQQWEK